MDILQALQHWSWSPAAWASGFLVIAAALWQWPQRAEEVLTALGEGLGDASRPSVEVARRERFRHLDPHNRRQRLR